MKKPLIVLTGPTAVGKTELSIQLAKRINGEIISADSMQVYKMMDIGTAKIKPEEMQGVRHHLIDVLDPSEDFNVFRFKEMADEAMEKIYAAGHIPIIAGGTGFYIQSVLYDIDFTDTDTDDKFRAQMYDIADKQGNMYVHSLLKEVDPDASLAIHPNNLKRVIRALEFHHQTGQQISEHNKEQSAKESPFNYIYFVLNDVREHIYERIDRRVDLMIENGLLDEVRSLMDKGYDKSLVSMKGLGYKEIIDYYNGLTTLDEAIRILKRDTRHFAKRQLTWFGREKDVTWVNLDSLDGGRSAALQYMLTQIKEHKICDCEEL